MQNKLKIHTRFIPDIYFPLSLEMPHVLDLGDACLPACLPANTLLSLAH